MTLPTPSPLASTPAVSLDPPALRRATRRSRLSPRSRKLWLTAHVATSVGWLGGAYCMVVLAVTGTLSEDAELRIACYELMHLFDRVVHIPLGLSMLASGVVVSVWTKWGLFRHRWVLTKFVVSTLTVVLTPLLAVPRVLDTISDLEAGVDPGSTPVEIVVISVAVVATLTAMTVISVFKPWGRTRWARGTAR